MSASKYDLFILCRIAHHKLQNLQYLIPQTTDAMKTPNKQNQNVCDCLFYLEISV